jgi:hypothetical protein
VKNEKLLDQIQLPERPENIVLFRSKGIDDKGDITVRISEELDRTLRKQWKQTYTAKGEPASILTKCFPEWDFYDVPEIRVIVN